MPSKAPQMQTPLVRPCNFKQDAIISKLALLHKVHQSLEKNRMVTQLLIATSGLVACTP